MRPRKKHHLEERLAACEGCFLTGEALEQGRLRDSFPNPQAPLHLEIGCGKGQFSYQMAQRHPEWNFIAMEREPNVMLDAAERLMAQPLPNLKLLLGDAEELPKLFLPGELARIYINFCDPWHKHRQYKRRLTYRERLKVYCNLLAPEGEIWFKTDNYMLYHFSLFEFDAVMNRYFTTTDLHASEYAADNVITEYEQRFTDLGQTIYAIRARKRGESPAAPI